MSSIIIVIIEAFPSTGEVNATDPGIFVDSITPRRRKRQAFVPLVCSELNYTDAHRVFCENDEACMCDLVAANDQSMATTSLESGKNFSAQVKVLSK